MDIIFTEHASFTVKRRGISKKIIREFVMHPQQSFSSETGRITIQGKYNDEIEGKDMLLRIIGIKKSGSFKIITVYKTSKIDKYWVKE